MVLEASCECPDEEVQIQLSILSNPYLFSKLDKSITQKVKIDFSKLNAEQLSKYFKFIHLNKNVDFKTVFSFIKTKISEMPLNDWILILFVLSPHIQSQSLIPIFNQTVLVLIMKNKGLVERTVSIDSEVSQSFN